MLAHAEPRVEQGPDDESLGGCLAGVGQTIRFFGSERFSHVLIRHLSPRNSCIIGVGIRSRCAFQLPGHPQCMVRGGGFRPRKQGVSPSRADSGAEASVRDPSRKTQSGIRHEPSSALRHPKLHESGRTG